MAFRFGSVRCHVLCFKIKSWLRIECFDFILYKVFLVQAYILLRYKSAYLRLYFNVICLVFFLLVLFLL